MLSLMLMSDYVVASVLVLVRFYAGVVVEGHRDETALFVATAAIRRRLISVWPNRACRTSGHA